MAGGLLGTTKVLPLRIHTDQAAGHKTCSMEDAAVGVLVGMPKVLQLTALAVRSGLGRCHCTCKMIFRLFPH
jgi:hypothetical protein